MVTAILTVHDSTTNQFKTFRLVIAFGVVDYAESVRVHAMVHSQEACVQCHATDHTLTGIRSVLDGSTVMRRRRWAQLEERRAYGDDPLLHDDGVSAVPVLCKTYTLSFACADSHSHDGRSPSSAKRDVAPGFIT